MTAMAKQTKKQDRFTMLLQSAFTKLSSCSPITPPSTSGAGQEGKYKRALTFLCAFPLYTIIESGMEGRGSFVKYELSNKFSLALSVSTNDKTYDNALSLSRLKKTAKSKCLLNFPNAIYGGSLLTASSLSCPAWAVTCYCLHTTMLMAWKNQ
jgi:hypothetical protein